MGKQRGFTLVELLIVILVVAVLAAISISSYTEQVHKSRRADVSNYLGQLQLSLERWRAENPCYAPSGNTNCTPNNYTSSGTYPTIITSYPATTSYYTVGIVYSASQPYYTLTAVPLASSAQKGDRCGTLCVLPPGSTATATCGTTKPLWGTAACN